MADQIKNVFISHVHEDDKKLSNLKDLLGSNGLEVRDGSITSEKPNNAKSPDYIKNEILKPHIDWAGCMLVYLSPETKDSEWVDWEIEYAHEKGKTIVGVWEQESEGCEIPEALDNYANAIVGWNADKIIDAINGEVEGFEDPDGVPSSERPIKHHKCS